MYDTLIVRYGEIFLKGEPVRKKFEKVLVRDIERRLKNSGIKYRIERKRHRFYLKTRETEKAGELLGKVFGIVSVSPALETKAEMEDILLEGVRVAKNIIEEDNTFAVRAERTGKHEFRSKDIENALGEKILGEINCQVNLDSPERTVFVEVRDNSAYIFHEKIPGSGGLPYGTQGKVVALISPGMNSPVAAWMLMCRGCKAIVLNFGDPQNIEGILSALEEFTGERIRFYNVDAAVSGRGGKYGCIIEKRIMLRVAEKVARGEDALGIVTGDNLGQVSGVIDSSVEIPVYRPLIGMEKEEIIEMGRGIGICKSVDKSSSYLPTRIEEIEELERELGIEEILNGIKIKCLRK